MNQILKRLEIIKSSITIEDQELIELQIMKLEKINIDDEVKNILANLKKSDFLTALSYIENYLLKYSDVVEYIDIEVENLKLELKYLKSKFYNIIEEKIEYINSIEEFNIQYNIHLGYIIKSILSLKKEILYKKIIKQQRLKFNYEEEIKLFDETEETITELKETISELKEALENINKDDENCDAIYKAYQKFGEELKNFEKELFSQRQKLDNIKDQLEDNKLFDEYEDIMSTYEKFACEYEHIQNIQKSRIGLSDNQRVEIKKLYKKVSILCLLYKIPDVFQERVNIIMESLSYRHSKKDITDVKMILDSLENLLISEYSNSSIKEKEQLKEYKLKISDIEEEINDIKNDEIFMFINKLDNWDEYFKELKLKLQKEKLTLEIESRDLKEEQKNLEDELFFQKQKSDEIIIIKYLSTSEIARQHNIQAKPHLFDELLELKLLYKDNKSYKLTDKGKKIGGNYKSSDKGEEWVVWEENSLNKIIEDLKIKLGLNSSEIQTLTTHQNEIYDNVITKINNIFNQTKDEDNRISISGSAGVGKTFLIIKIIQYLKENEFALMVTTPTHKSLSVITNNLHKYKINDISTKTLHSFLQLKLEIDERTGSKIFVIDEKNKEQNTTEVLIVDESSMIGNDLFDFINQSIAQGKIKVVLFVGDPYQLPPVNSEKNTIFELKNSYFLEEIIRQKKDSYIIDIATRIRDCIINQDFSLKIEEFFQGRFNDLKLFTHKDDFLNHFFKNDSEYWYSKNQIIADYTNKSVDMYNIIARKRYWSDRGILNPKEIEIDDIVVFQEAVLDGEKVIYQNGSITKVKKLNQGYDNELGLSFWLCEDEYERKFNIVNHLSSDKYQHMLETKIKEAKNAKAGYEKKIKWTEYYKLKEKYASIKFNYSSTVHKLQGSTYDTVFIDIRKMQSLYKYSNNIEKEFLYRLLYVAVTRASKNINILIENSNR